MDPIKEYRRAYNLSTTAASTEIQNKIGRFTLELIGNNWVLFPERKDLIGEKIVGFSITYVLAVTMYRIALRVTNV